MNKFPIALLIGWLAMTSHPLKAQSAADLALQLELDTEKLTSMKATLQNMYSSYEIIDKGYKNISSIAQGNFNLHKAFLDGLLAISPAVRDNPRIQAALNAQYSLISEAKAATTRYRSGSPFTAQEIDYIITVYSTLLQRCLQSIEDLTMILTADELRMSDDQRLQAVNRVYNDTNNELSFLRQFNNSLATQAAQRTKELNDLQTLKRLYGLPD